MKKLALIAAITAATGAQADLVAMDDAALSMTTGQAGLTIDINKANINIGAIDYKDQGFLSIKDIVLDSNLFDGSGIDNIKMTIDVAGDGSDLGVSNLGSAYLTANGAAVIGLNEVDQNGQISEGDLIISLRAIDSTNGAQSVDFGLSIGSVGLGASSEAAGSVTDGTILVQDLELAGYLGPIDIVIDGSGDGMNISAFFNAEGSLDMPFMAVTSNLNIHNSRGSSLTLLGAGTENSFAHVQMNISQGTNIDGDTALAFDLQDFSADIDLTNIQLGNNGKTIGDIYITDFQMAAETVVYGH